MLVHTYATYISCRLHSIPPLLFKGHRLTGESGDFEDLFSRVLRMLPMTVTSLHSPGVTPCSKYPEGCISRMPFVLRPSDSISTREPRGGQCLQKLMKVTHSILHHTVMLHAAHWCVFDISTCIYMQVKMNVNFSSEVVHPLPSRDPWQLLNTTQFY